MSSAVVNLRNAVLAGNQSLTKLLRQAKVIAACLNLNDVERWVDLELNGYPVNAALPEYRHISTHSVEILNPFKGWEFVGHHHCQLPATQPITEIEELSKGDDICTELREKVSIVSPLADVLPDPEVDAMAQNWDQRATVGGAEFKRILDAVTNELLQWTIELQKRGIKGEDMDFNDKEKQAATHQSFYIQKVVGVAGNVHSSQVTVYDYSSVNQLLVDHGIPKQDRRELEDIIDEMKDSPPDKKRSLLQRGEEWIVKHKELLGAGAAVVGKAITAGANQK